MDYFLSIFSVNMYDIAKVNKLTKMLVIVYIGCLIVQSLMYKKYLFYHQNL